MPRWSHFDREGAMQKVWFGLAFTAAAIIANPAPAQDYHRNFAECAKELGLDPDAGYTISCKTAGRYEDGISAAKLNRRHSMIASPGRRVSHLSPPLRGELHAE